MLVSIPAVFLLAKALFAVILYSLIEKEAATSSIFQIQANSTVAADAVLVLPLFPQASVFPLQAPVKTHYNDNHTVGEITFAESNHAPVKIQVNDNHTVGESSFFAESNKFNLAINALETMSQSPLRLQTPSLLPPPIAANPVQVGNDTCHVSSAREVILEPSSLKVIGLYISFNIQKTLLADMTRVFLLYSEP
jgi:hypothetical protein